MKNKPLVSVIIPTYNRANLLLRAIKSVLSQTYKNLELIIVDDCSTDNTGEVVRKLQRKDKRIKYIKHRENRGGSAARNTGIKVAKGEYVAFQDSDDKWIQDKLEKQLAVLKKFPDEKTIIYTAFIKIMNKDAFYLPGKKVKKKNGMIFNELIKNNFIGLPTVLINKSCLDEVGSFDERFPRSQDWELFLRLAKKFPFEFIDEPLLLVFYQEKSISADFKSFIKSRKMILERHKHEIKNIKGLLSKFEYEIGSHQLIYGNRAEGLVRISKSIILKLFSYTQK